MLFSLAHSCARFRRRILVRQMMTSLCPSSGWKQQRSCRRLLTHSLCPRACARQMAGITTDVPKCFTLWQESVCMRSKAWLAASVWLRLARMPPPASRVRRSRRLRDTLAAAASSHAATCKQGAALTSPARHACSCARPSCAQKQ